MGEKVIGTIGRSGLYEMEGLERLAEEEVEAPLGKPSDCYLVSRRGGRPVAGWVER